jgi:hypothetical protein
VKAKTRQNNDDWEQVSMSLDEGDVKRALFGGVGVGKIMIEDH